MVFQILFVRWIEALLKKFFSISPHPQPPKSHASLIYLKMKSALKISIAIIHDKLKLSLNPIIVPF